MPLEGLASTLLAGARETPRHLIPGYTVESSGGALGDSGGPVLDLTMLLERLSALLYSVPRQPLLALAAAVGLVAAMVLAYIVVSELRFASEQRLLASRGRRTQIPNIQFYVYGGVRSILRQVYLRLLRRLLEKGFKVSEANTMAELVERTGCSEAWCVSSLSSFYKVMYGTCRGCEKEVREALRLEELTRIS